MKYRNPQIPEGINTSDRHPLKEFAILAGGALLLVIVLAWLLGEAGGRLARLLPFEHEAALAPETLLSSDAPAELQAYLDTLASRVSVAMALPEGMSVRIHFSADDTFNAFATLGGNVLLYRGLVEKLPHENALAMLIAHEIAHVHHRDPIVSIGRGAAIQLVVGLLFGDPNLAALGRAGIYTQLHFNREMESAADTAALDVVNRLYGHIAGASDLFKVMRTERVRRGDGEAPAMFSTHPLDAQRVQATRDSALARQWEQTGTTTPLPASFAAWMKASAERAQQADKQQH